MKPHVPQMPSRQSLSNAMGSSPLSVSSSFTTSSISRNDISGFTSRASYWTIRPGSPALFWRQTCSVRRMLLVAPLSGRHVLELQRLPVEYGRLVEAFEFARGCEGKMRVVTQRLGVG